MARIRLLLVDDHVLFRQSLRRLLASEPDFEVVADCGTVTEALDLLRRERVDIALLDFDLGHDHGSQLIAACRQAGLPVKVVMVTAGMTASQSATALRLGASGIFLKHDSPSALLHAIRLVSDGALWVDQRIMQEMAAQMNEPHTPPEQPRLTEHEQQVLQGVFEGLANKEIGAHLGVSESAVKATLQRLFRKTGVRTRSQLVRVALEGAFASGRKI
jgi:DNA-binding NarL/FixJ family response regulator